ncbi:hypothetical protein GMST_10450 [Geomonas silvestris]|uniref:Uncharacterized protein n=1 Tax=Geomonas silvestris TaxID=2740184 RepID=A0A6V8MFF4_9BACT|nr:hypothetical protein GMST_10450 [Geomonas silvestris]
MGELLFIGEAGLATHAWVVASVPKKGGAGASPASVPTPERGNASEYAAAEGVEPELRPLESAGKAKSESPLLQRGGREDSFAS